MLFHPLFTFRHFSPHLCPCVNPCLHSLSPYMCRRRWFLGPSLCWSWVNPGWQFNGPKTCGYSVYRVWPDICTQLTDERWKGDLGETKKERNGRCVLNLQNSVQNKVKKWKRNNINHYSELTLFLKMWHEDFPLHTVLWMNTTLFLSNPTTPCCSTFGLPKPILDIFVCFNLMTISLWAFKILSQTFIGQF